MDPRIQTPDIRQDPRSPLMRAKAKAAEAGGKANACPYGCTTEDIDENGYCDHLIGFSTDQKTYEPLILDNRTGRRNVQVPMVDSGKKGRDDQGEFPILKPQPVPIPKGSTLIQITTSYRVYHPGVEKKQTA